MFFIFSCIIAFAGTPVSASFDCPDIIEISPLNKVVVKYGDPISANCSSLSNSTEGMGWESSSGTVPLTEGVTFLSFETKAETWDMAPKCYINLISGEQCLRNLQLTIYKMADSVSMSQSQMGTMVEGKTYRMQCDIANVAPGKNLFVDWHIGDKIVYTQSYDKESSQFPVNLSSVFNLTAKGGYDGAKIWCEARLNIGKSRPMPSASHKMTVLHPPTFIQPGEETVTLKAGGKIDLNCTAAGNPVPSYTWHNPDFITKKNEKQPILSVSHAGTYNCTVSNNQGTQKKYFIVIYAERDYTVLAALLGGFGALAVALLILGYFTLKPDGTFSFCKGSASTVI